MKQIFISSIASALILVSCGNNKNHFDASGSFEAEETIISAEASGVLKLFNVAEGQTLQAGQTIGYIDSTQLYLKKKQMEAQIKAVLSGMPDEGKQVAVLEEQLKNAEHEQKRFANLVQARLVESVSAMPEEKVTETLKAMRAGHAH